MCERVCLILPIRRDLYEFCYERYWSLGIPKIGRDLGFAWSYAGMDRIDPKGAN